MEIKEAVVMEQIVKFETVQISTLNLKSDDILIVKLIGDEMGETDFNSLKDHLNTVFVKNKVLVFSMPTNSDIVFEKIVPETQSCSTAAKGYCDDCSCGKKDAALP